ncbi:hypothetical protein ANO14919_110650 [Xylariales sp. No.14919]|nr:hypothetical protein ANO14919_110650 [Xylariales sp. No.14919]
MDFENTGDHPTIYIIILLISLVVQYRSAQHVGETDLKGKAAFLLWLCSVFAGVACIVLLVPEDTTKTDPMAHFAGSTNSKKVAEAILSTETLSKLYQIVYIILIFVSLTVFRNTHHVDVGGHGGTFALILSLCSVFVGITCAFLLGSSYVF